MPDGNLYFRFVDEYSIELSIYTTRIDGVYLLGRRKTVLCKRRGGASSSAEGNLIRGF